MSSQEKSDTKGSRGTLRTAPATQTTTRAQSHSRGSGYCTRRAKPLPTLNQGDSRPQPTSLDQAQSSGCREDPEVLTSLCMRFIHTDLQWFSSVHFSSLNVGVVRVFALFVGYPAWYSLNFLAMWIKVFDYLGEVLSCYFFNYLCLFTPLFSFRESNCTDIIPQSLDGLFCLFFCFTLG